MWKISSETFRKTNKSKNPAVFHKVRQKSGVENFVEKKSTFAFSVFNTVLQNKNCRICRTLTGKADFSTVSTASTTSTAKKNIIFIYGLYRRRWEREGHIQAFPLGGSRRDAPTCRAGACSRRLGSPVQGELARKRLRGCTTLLKSFLLCNNPSVMLRMTPPFAQGRLDCGGSKPPPYRFAYPLNIHFNNSILT